LLPWCVVIVFQFFLFLLLKGTILHALVMSMWG
jgi:hypothetical protein